MSASRDINMVNQGAENIGRDRQEEMREPRGGDSDDGPRPLLSESRRAMRELASALEQDSDSWQSEREAWEKERASLQESLEYKERYVVMLNKETKRLSRVIGDAKHETQRLEREASRLRAENDDLLARNARLNERSLEVRRQAETLAERNRKLKATLERELLGDVDLNSAAGNRSSKRIATSIPAAVDRKSSDSATARAASSKLTENIQGILVPNPRHRPTETSAPVLSNPSSRTTTTTTTTTNRRRKAPHRNDDHSDTEEIVTPKSTAPHGGGSYNSTGAASLRQPKPTPRRGVEGGWRVAIEGLPAEPSSRRLGGGSSEGAPSIAKPQQPLLPFRDDERGGGGGGGMGDSRGGPMVKREVDGGGEVVLLADRWGRGGDSSCIGENPTGKTDVIPRRTRPRSERSRSSESSSSSSSGSSSSSSSSRNNKSLHLLSGSETSRGGGAPFPSENILRGPFAQHHAPTPAAEFSRPTTGNASKPSSSFSSSGRKRSRLSLGGGRTVDDGRPNTGTIAARSVEVTEMLEAPRQQQQQRSPAAAVEARRASSAPDSLGVTGSVSLEASRREVDGGAERRTNGDKRFVPKERESMLDGAAPRGGLKAEGKCRDYGASGRGSFKNGVEASRAEAAARGGREEGARGVFSGNNNGGGGGGGGTGADSSATTSTVTTTPMNEATYPCLTMAVVKTSPKRKKTKRGQRHQQDASTVHRHTSGSNDSRGGPGRPKGGQSASTGGGGASDRPGLVRQRSPPRRAQGARGSEDGKCGGMDACVPGDESEHRCSEDIADDKRDDLRRKPRSRQEPNETVHKRGFATGGERETVVPVDEEQAAGVVDAPGVTPHQQVPNPYATEGVRGGNGGSREQPNGERPAVGYKYQEVVRDRSKRAMMKGHDCEHCMAYLEAVGGSPGEREAMLNMCSRHRHTEANGRPAETPEGFWDLSFADSVNPDKELQQQQQQQQRRRLQGRGSGKNGQGNEDDCSLGF